MTSLTTSLVPSLNPSVHLQSGSSLKPVDQSMGSVSTSNLSYGPRCTPKLQLSTPRRPLKIKARDGGRQDAASIFVGDFVHGGAAVRALCLKVSLFSSSQRRKAHVSSQMFSKALVGDEKEIGDEESKNEEHETEDGEHETEDKYEENENEDEETKNDEETLEKQKMVADMIADINSALDTVVDRIQNDLDYDPDEVYLDLDKEEYGSFVGPVEYQSII